MQKMRICFLLVWVLCLAMQGNSQKKQVGKASYYGKKAHGRNTSSGERYHVDSMTCAHRTYPFGTLLKVRDINTDREVVVKVTDRGPFSKGRVIDLSYAAAKELDMLGRGIAHVEIVKVDSDVKIPYRVDDAVEMPRLEVKDPEGDGYCLLSEWAERKHRQDERKLAAKNVRKKNAPGTGIQKHRPDSIPRWKIFDKLSAQSEADEGREFRYLVK